MPLRLTAAFFLAAKLLLPAQHLCAEEFDLNFTVSSEGGRLIPLSAPVLLTLSVTRSLGQPAAGWVTVRLDAPLRKWFLSTDFPAVEGTRLLEMRVPLKDGKIEWRQEFPIRGDYRLVADFAEASGGRANEAFVFRVHENRLKWLALGALLAGLFIAGVLAGRFFSAPKLARFSAVGFWLMCSWLEMGGAGEITGAKAEGKRDPSSLEVAAARVGAPTRIRWFFDPNAITGDPAVGLTLKITQLEKNKAVFAVEKISTRGEFFVDYQFTDGTDHRVTAIAEIASGKRLIAEKTVSVTAVAPPWRAKFAALLLFLAVIAAGLAAGRWSRRGLALHQTIHNRSSAEEADKLPPV